MATVSSPRVATPKSAYRLTISNRGGRDAAFRALALRAIASLGGRPDPVRGERNLARLRESAEWGIALFREDRGHEAAAFLPAPGHYSAAAMKRHARAALRDPGVSKAGWTLAEPYLIPRPGAVDWEAVAYNAKLLAG